MKKIILVWIFIFVLFSVNNVYSFVPKNIYTFDTNFTSSLNVVDDYGNSNLSVKVGGIGQYVKSSNDNKSNLSLVSFWYGYINTLDVNGTIVLDSDYSISLWFKYNVNTINDKHGLFRMSDGVNSLDIHKRTNQLLEVNQDAFGVGSMINHSTWYHLLIRRNSTTSQLYLNDVLIKSGFTTPTGITELHILDGVDSGAIREFSGWMDEFYVFDDFVNNSEITQLSNGIYIDDILSMSNCTELWISDNTACNGFNYTIQYYDYYNCGTTNTLPIDNGTSVGCVVENNCADEICLNPVYANETCCIVTPTISCSEYNYLLYNNNGSIIESGNLTVFNQAINSYFYYFNQDIGTYYTKICDESTRQINVVERDGMTITDWTIIIMLILWVVSLILSIIIRPIIILISGLITLFMTIFFIALGYPYYVYIITIILTIIQLWIGFFGLKEK